MSSILCVSNELVKMSILSFNNQAYKCLLDTSLTSENSCWNYGRIFIIKFLFYIYFSSFSLMIISIISFSCSEIKVLTITSKSYYSPTNINDIFPVWELIIFELRHIYLSISICFLHSSNIWFTLNPFTCGIRSMITSLSFKT